MSYYNKFTETALYKPLQLSASLLELLLKNQLIFIDKTNEQINQNRKDVYNIRLNELKLEEYNLKIPIGTLDVKKNYISFYSNKFDIVDIIEYGICNDFMFPKSSKIPLLSIDYPRYLDYIKHKYDSFMKFYMETTKKYIREENLPRLSIGISKNNDSFNDNSSNYKLGELFTSPEYISDIITYLKIKYQYQIFNNKNNKNNTNKWKLTKNSKHKLSTYRKRNTFKNTTYYRNLLKIKNENIKIINDEYVIHKEINYKGHKYIFIGYPNNISMMQHISYFNNEKHKEILELQKINFETELINFHNFINEPNLHIQSTKDYYKFNNSMSFLNYYFDVIISNYLNFDKLKIDEFKTKLIEFLNPKIVNEIKQQVNQINTTLRYQFYIFNGYNLDESGYPRSDNFYPAFYSLRQINTTHTKLLEDLQLFIRESLTRKFNISNDPTYISNNFLIWYKLGSLLTFHVDYMHPLSEMSFDANHFRNQIQLQEIINCSSVLCENSTDEFKQYQGFPYYSVVDFKYNTQSYHIKDYGAVKYSPEHSTIQELKYEFDTELLPLLNNTAKVIYHTNTHHPKIKRIYISKSIIKSLLPNGQEEYLYLELEGIVKNVKEIFNLTEPFISGRLSKNYLVYSNNVENQNFYKIINLTRIQNIGKSNLEKLKKFLLLLAINNNSINYDPTFTISNYEHNMEIPNFYFYTNTICKSFINYLYYNKKYEITNTVNSTFKQQEQDRKFKKCILNIENPPWKLECNSQIEFCFEKPIIINETYKKCYYEDSLYFYNLFENKLEFISDPSSISLALYQIPKELYNLYYPSASEEQTYNILNTSNNYNLLIPITKTKNYLPVIEYTTTHQTYDSINKIIYKILNDIKIKIPLFNPSNYQAYVHTFNEPQNMCIHIHIRPRTTKFNPEVHILNITNGINTNQRNLNWDQINNYRKINPSICKIICSNKFFMESKYIFNFISKPPIQQISIPITTTNTLVPKFKSHRIPTSPIPLSILQVNNLN
jgi:hypothetical protein